MKARVIKKRGKVELLRQSLPVPAYLIQVNGMTVRSTPHTRPDRAEEIFELQCKICQE